jgi:hypothetical protein
MSSNNNHANSHFRNSNNGAIPRTIRSQQRVQAAPIRNKYGVVLPTQSTDLQNMRMTNVLPRDSVSNKGQGQRSGDPFVNRLATSSPKEKQVKPTSTTDSSVDNIDRTDGESNHVDLLITEDSPKSCSLILVSACNATCKDLHMTDSARRDFFGDHDVVEYARGHQQWLETLNCSRTHPRGLVQSLVTQKCEVACLGSGRLYSRVEPSRQCYGGEWGSCNSQCIQYRAFFYPLEKDCSHIAAQERSCSSFNCAVDVGDYLIGLQLNFAKTRNINAGIWKHLSLLQMNEMLDALELLLQVSLFEYSITMLVNDYLGNR